MQLGAIFSRFFTHQSYLFKIVWLFCAFVCKTRGNQGSETERVEIGQAINRIWNSVGSLKLSGDALQSLNWLTAVTKEHLQLTNNTEDYSLEAVRGVIEKVTSCPSKTLEECIIATVDAFFSNLIEKGPTGSFLAIKACDPTINRATATKLSSNKYFFGNLEKVADGMRLLAVNGVKIDKKSSETAVELFRVKFNLHLSKPDKTIWHLLNQVLLIGMHSITKDEKRLCEFAKFIVERELILSDWVSLAELFELFTDYQHCSLVEGWSGFVQREISPLSVVSLFLTSNRQTNNTSSIWNAIALKLLDFPAKNAEQLLNDNWSSEYKDRFPFLLLEKKTEYAIYLINNVSLRSSIEFYSIFIFGVSFGNSDETILRGIANISKERLVTLVGFLNASNFKRQTAFAYLDLQQLFTEKDESMEIKSKFHTDYALGLTENEETRKMIRLIPADYQFHAFNQLIPFVMYKGMDWDRCVSRHYHYLINCILVEVANDFNESTAILEYLGLEGRQLHLLQHLSHYGYIDCTLDKVRYQFQDYRNLFDKAIEDNKKLLEQIASEHSECLERKKLIIESNRALKRINARRFANDIDMFSLQASILNDFSMSRFDREEYVTIRLLVHTGSTVFNYNYPLEDAKLYEFGRCSFAIEAIYLQTSYTNYYQKSEGKALIMAFLNLKRSYRPSPSLSLVKPPMGLTKSHKLTLGFGKLLAKDPVVAGIRQWIKLYYETPIQLEVDNRIHVIFEGVLKEASPRIGAALQIAKISTRIFNQAIYNSIIENGELLVNFFWHLLKIHFEMDIFDWQAFINASELEKPQRWDTGNLTFGEIKQRARESGIFKSIPTSIDALEKELQKIIDTFLINK